jgi:wyosine [tRNA(Phe)-imidazoG37] synthetase (radical SAM superfamily)
MNHVFGPVPSRRLGQSLGIDTIPLKTCNWNCVYCQLGRTVPLTNERREYVPCSAILAEVAEALETHQPHEIDWVTFVGSGEPTLHSGIGQLIRQVKTLSNKPVAVITNGSLLHLPEVRKELSEADAVLPTFDAGNSRLYRKINRPHPDCTFERLLDGLVAFRREYDGKLWVEVMLVHGLNDTSQALLEIAAHLREIQPDEIHINLPDRPPAETWVELPDDEAMMLALSILGTAAHVVHPAEGTFDLGGHKTLVDAVIAIITRHPMREEDLVKALNEWTSDELSATLEDLKKCGKAQVIERHGHRFWSAISAHYPQEN